jgi:hypothetical protein
MLVLEPTFPVSALIRTLGLPCIIRGTSSRNRCALIFTGQHSDYHWLSTSTYDLPSLLRSCPEIFVGKYIAVTSFDAGPLVPLKDEEKAAGLEPLLRWLETNLPMSQSHFEPPPSVTIKEFVEASTTIGTHTAVPIIQIPIDERKR